MTTHEEQAQQVASWPWLARLATLLKVLAWLNVAGGAFGTLLWVSSTNADNDGGSWWLVGKFIALVVSIALTFVVLMGASEAARLLLHLGARASRAESVG